VDLRDRRGGDRLGVDFREKLRSEFLADHCFDLREGNRRDFVHEAAELLDVDVREQVRARGEQLAELDVRRAELFERAPELAGAFACRGSGTDDGDLAQHSEQPASARDAGDVNGSPKPCCPRAHRARVPA
jgi:hypothetical protein